MSQPSEPTAQATIKDARVAAAHEGVAELIVCIEYANGGTTEVTLDQMASEALMKSCAAKTLADIKGCSWELVRDALQVSYNRFVK